MDINAAYREVGSYRAAAKLCGTTPKTVKRAVAAAEAEAAGPAPAVAHNYDTVADIVAERVTKTNGLISAKRLLPTARAAGYDGSARNFRRLVAKAKRAWRSDHHRGQRPGVLSPGDMLVIDWGQIGSLSVFCAVLAWSRVRFVCFADNQRSETTLAALAACFEALGGVPKTVLSDRMGCLKGGTVAGVVVPTPDYVRFANHYSFRPDFCQGADPESKGLVENLVGYVKSDLMVPAELTVKDLAAANAAGVVWAAEVNGQLHSEVCAVPAERLLVEAPLLGALPSLRARTGKLVIRKVDRLSCVRFGSARYSVPTRHIGKQVEVRVADGTVDGVTVWQRCDCGRSDGLPPQPRIGDFNTEIELCRACGLVPLRSGSRWSVWFCGPCATQAKRLNGRVGRCVVPIGRHSLMNGVSARSDSSEEIDILAAQLPKLFDAMDAVGQWARVVVRENLVAAGQPHDVDMDLSTYLASVHSSATPEDRFAEMVAHLLEPA